LLAETSHSYLHHLAAISTQDVAIAVQSRIEADAAVRRAQAAIAQAQSNVPVILAQLDDALFNLDQCKMRAPTNGYVVNWLVQPGTMLSPVTAAAPFTTAGFAPMNAWTTGSQIRSRCRRVDRLRRNPAAATAAITRL
jgi:multidrug efflux pump subunit AcrA (membrane-fusion protein)